MRRQSLSYQAQLGLFFTPYLLGSVVLVLVPAVITAVIAFTNYNAIEQPLWAGLDNFRQLLASPIVRLSLRNTLFFLILAVPLRVLGGLFFALLLQKRGRLFGLYRAAVYLPTVIPEVAYALVWLWIFNPVAGPLNQLLGVAGLPTPAWLAGETTAVLSIVILLAFQLGEGFVLLLAGLQTIPRSFYESATVDGATSWQSFWRITLPLLTPWLLLLTFRDLVVSLQNTFTPSFVLTYGGPYYATTFTPLLVYELAFDFFDLGLAAALLLLTYLLLVLLVVGMMNLLQEIGEGPRA
ncbi:MAG: sugar ABC transporter permease [Chloroflexota bacterium]